MDKIVLSNRIENISTAYGGTEVKNDEVYFYFIRKYGGKILIKL